VHPCVGLGGGGQRSEEGYGVAADTRERTRGTHAQQLEHVVKRRQDRTLPLLARVWELLDESEHGRYDSARLAPTESAHLLSGEVPEDHEHTANLIGRRRRTTTRPSQVVRHELGDDATKKRVSLLGRRVART
jgi:hypothetical protein